MILLPDASTTLSKMAAFLCTHFVDQRIINPGNVMLLPYNYRRKWQTYLPYSFIRWQRNKLLAYFCGPWADISVFSSSNFKVMFRKISNLTFGCWLITSWMIRVLVVYFLSSVGRLSSIVNCSLSLDGRWIVVVWKSFVFVGCSVDCRRLEVVRFRWLVIRLWFIESHSFSLVDFHRLKLVHFRYLVGRLSSIVSLSIVLAGG